MSTNTRLLEPGEFSDWDEAVLATPTGSLFHTTHWLRASGTPFRIYGVFNADRLVGGFTACHLPDDRRSLRSARPPQTPYGGLVVLEQASHRVASYSHHKNVSRLCAVTLKDDFNRINVRLSPSVIDIQPFLWEGYTGRIRYTYLVDISQLDDTLAGMDAKRRNDITRAERSGLALDTNVAVTDCLQIFKATRGDIDKWAPIMCRYDESLGSLGMGKALGIRDGGGKLVAAVYLVWDRFHCYYLLGGYSECEDSGNAETVRGAQSLAIWKAMEFAREVLSLHRFDLEGSMIPGVESYFRKFGGRLQPFYEISWERPQSRVESVLTWSEKAFRAAVRRIKGKK